MTTDHSDTLDRHLAARSLLCVACLFFLCVGIYGRTYHSFCVAPTVLFLVAPMNDSNRGETGAAPRGPLIRWSPFPPF